MAGLQPASANRRVAFRCDRAAGAESRLKGAGSSEHAIRPMGNTERQRWVHACKCGSGGWPEPHFYFRPVLRHFRTRSLVLAALRERGSHTEPEKYLAPVLRARLNPPQMPCLNVGGAKLGSWRGFSQLTIAGTES